jgi:hypothetical protein
LEIAVWCRPPSRSEGSRQSPGRDPSLARKIGDARGLFDIRPYDFFEPVDNLLIALGLPGPHDSKASHDALVADIRRKIGPPILSFGAGFAPMVMALADLPLG